MWANGEVLVPLDGSTVAENALPHARVVAKAIDRPVRLLHVVNEREGIWSASDVARARTLFRDYAKRVADQYALPPDGLRIDLDYGDPAARILAAAENASAIVIGTHGRGGIRANLIGSVADKVIRGAPVPTFVVPGAAEAPPVPDESRPVIVAVDGSEQAEAALAYARAFSDAIGARRVLLRAHIVPAPVASEFVYYPSDYASILEAGAREYLASIALPGEEKLLVSGEASNAIVEAASTLDAGLVVMASTGKGLVRRLVLGSTTNRVVHSIDRPLLIIPPEQEE